MFERRHHQLASRAKFARRLLNCVGLAALLIAAALTVGVVGYRILGGLPWVDALLNASMILGGMGPVDALHTDAAKIFASLYALFSGIVFIGVMGIVLAPFVHRSLHKFHLDEKDVDDHKRKT